MKNLFLLLCCIFATVTMSSCTADAIESDNPAIHADDVTNPLPIPNIPGDTGDDDKDKDKDGF